MALIPDGATALVKGPAYFSEATAKAIAACKDGIARLKAGQGSTLERLEAYDEAMAALSDASAAASVVRNAHPDPVIRERADEAEQQLEALATDVSLDRGVFDALSGLARDGLDAVTTRWLDKLLRDFRRAGVDRDEATRTQIRALNEELVRIGQEFGKTIREDVRTVSFHLGELDGLPSDYLRSHAPGPDGRVAITTDYPDLLPFMAYARSGTAREQLWRANRQRGFPGNQAVLQQLLVKRSELARLLGYASWAAYVTEDKMIGSADKAAAFIEQITQASAVRMKADYAVLLERKKVDAPTAAKVDPWDQVYLEDRVRAEKLAFDSQEVRPYFEYNRVKQGVLDVTAKLFGLRYERLADAALWHTDVEAYDVYEGAERLGRLFLDMHPREGKFKHAAQFTVRSGKAGVRLPEGALLCNFPKPGAQPALMQHSDVQTFFHEFGHLLHHILGGHTRWAALAGVQTEWDFVEAPSQLLEEWTWDPKVLATFARHHVTDEPIPADLVKRMRDAENFGKGLWVRQQMFYAALSLELYRNDPSLDPVAKVRELQSKYTPFPYVEGTYFHLAFGHLIGYSAIYYTYMWSLVIAKDLMSVFQREGMMNPRAAQKYRQAVLAPGGSADAAQLVRDFLGRDSSFEAYERWLNARPAA
jgi:thimet oligopeptidase